jgi:hypothetical protein
MTHPPSKLRRLPGARIPAGWPRRLLRCGEGLDGGARGIRTPSATGSFSSRIEPRIDEFFASIIVDAARETALVFSSALSPVELVTFNHRVLGSSPRRLTPYPAQINTFRADCADDRGPIVQIEADATIVVRS